ncbi:MAG: domain containing protein, partial [Proteobacteria bacterium]|nr:domain containing protein [Pseudomonadota bacterium]
SVNFTGSGSDPDNNLPLTYSWSFPGGTPASSTAQNPGAVTYNTAGTFTASFTVRDSLGLASAVVTRTVTVTPVANQAPLATINSPAANVTIAQGASVNFTGSGSDPDNNLPLTYSWSFPGGTPASSTAQNPGAVTYNTAGTFTASFTVRDSLGLASTVVTRTVTVTPATALPVARIDNPRANVTVTQGQTVSFEGTPVDSENNRPFTYLWTFPGGVPSTSTRQDPEEIRFNTAGTFIVSFQVTNARGAVSLPVTRSITVTPSGQAPLASITAPAGNVSIARGGTVNFQGAGSTSTNRLPLTYNWSFPGGTPASSTAQNPGPVSFNSIGTFTVTFTVTDRRGLVSPPVSRTVTVTEPSQPPLAAINAPAGNVSIVQGQTVSFQGSGSDPDNNLPLTYSWSFPGGTPASSTAQNPGPVTFGTLGVFTVSFTVTDSTGLASPPVTRTVTVTPIKPLANIVTPAINVSLLPGGSVNFRGVGEGTPSLPLTYRWTFPGGRPETSTAQNPSGVRFRNAGRFTVTLTVTDSARRVSEPATRVITVAEANGRPPRINECTANDDDDDD